MKLTFTLSGCVHKDWVDRQDEEWAFLKKKMFAEFERQFGCEPEALREWLDERGVPVGELRA